MGAAFAAATLFFLVLCSYYILRPIRDELGTRNPGELQWLFTGTFVLSLMTVPLFGWASSRFARRRLLPAVLGFVTANVLAFYLVFRIAGIDGAPAYAFFIWLSVYNMAVISILWSFCNDVFQYERAKRLYGFVAAGASVGAITGPMLTATLVMRVGATNLMLLAGLLLLAAVPVAFYLSRWGEREQRSEAIPIGGETWEGVRLALRSPYLLKIAMLLLAITFMNTVLYFEQASILKSHVADAEQRTSILAGIDLAVNALTLAIELAALRSLLARFRIPRVLNVLFGLTAAGFIALSVFPGVLVLAAVQVFRRSSDYAMVRPIREILFTVVSREENYKAKNFLDVVVFRGGDAASGWAVAGLRGLFAAPQVAAFAIPVAVGAAWVASTLEPPAEKHLKEEAQHVA